MSTLVLTAIEQWSDRPRIQHTAWFAKALEITLDWMSCLRDPAAYVTRRNSSGPSLFHDAVFRRRG